MRDVLAAIFNATLDSGKHAEWKQEHELMKLFYGDFKRADAHHMASVAWDATGCD